MLTNESSIVAASRIHRLSRRSHHRDRYVGGVRNCSSSECRWAEGRRLRHHALRLLLRSLHRRSLFHLQQRGLPDEHSFSRYGFVDANVFPGLHCKSPGERGDIGTLVLIFADIRNSGSHSYCQHWVEILSGIHVSDSHFDHRHLLLLS